jgi:hypothetical protein
VVTCEDKSLSLSHYLSASSKPQVTGDFSLGPNLPKEKEPPHRGDIGWDRFLLRQFGLQSYSLFPSYKLCDNRPNVAHGLGAESVWAYDRGVWSHLVELHDLRALIVYNINLEHDMCTIRVERFTFVGLHDLL